MSFATILALDLGKFKSVLCIMDVATRTHRFLAVESSPQAIREAIAQQVSTDPALTLVVFETCDTCGWVHDQLAPLKRMVLCISNRFASQPGLCPRPRLVSLFRLSGATEKIEPSEIPRKRLRMTAKGIHSWLVIPQPSRLTSSAWRR